MTIFRRWLLTTEDAEVTEDCFLIKETPFKLSFRTSERKASAIRNPARQQTTRCLDSRFAAQGEPRGGERVNRMFALGFGATHDCAATKCEFRAAQGCARAVAGMTTLILVQSFPKTRKPAAQTHDRPKDLEDSIVVLKSKALVLADIRMHGLVRGKERVFPQHVAGLQIVDRAMHYLAHIVAVARVQRA